MKWIAGYSPNWMTLEYKTKDMIKDDEIYLLHRTSNSGHSVSNPMHGSDILKELEKATHHPEEERDWWTKCRFIYSVSTLG